MARSQSSVGIRAAVTVQPCCSFPSVDICGERTPLCVDVGLQVGFLQLAKQLPFFQRALLLVSAGWIRVGSRYEQSLALLCVLRAKC